MMVQAAQYLVVQYMKQLSSQVVWPRLRGYWLVSSILYTLVMALISITNDAVLEQQHLYFKDTHPLSHSTRGDGTQFLNNSYEWQLNYAFFIGYSWVLQVLKAVASIFPNHKLILILLGITLNKLLVALAVIRLYRISLYLTKNEKVAKAASLLFLFSPAAVFYHCLYSQPLFCWLTFWAIDLALHRNWIHYTSWLQHIHQPLAFLRAAASSLALFFLASTLRSTTQFLSLLYGVPVIAFIWSNTNYVKRVKALLTGALVLFVFLAYMAVHNYVGYLQFCQLPEPSSFCDSIVPNIYSFVQQRYWGVGFLNFFQLRWMSSIVTSLPTFLIVLLSFKTRYETNNSATVGLVLSFVAQFLVLTFVAFLGSLTRLISTHPLFYVNLALYISKCHGYIRRYLITGYFLWYTVRGLVHLPVGQPWF